MPRTVTLLAGLVAVALLLVGGTPISARQGISITFTNFGSGAWPAGPDFATDVLGDPWEFCNPEDVAP